MLGALTSKSRVVLALAALGLLRCGSCASERDPQPADGGDAASSDATGGAGGAVVDAQGGGGSAPDASGGTGGSGGVLSDAGLTPEQAWLADPEAWLPVPGTEFTQPLCPVFEAKGSEIGFAKLGWQPCGAGCESTLLGEGYGERGALPTATTYELAGGASAFLTYDLSVKTPSVWHYLRRVVRLDDGATVGVLDGRRKPNAAIDTCVFGNGRESARANALLGGEPGSEMRMLAPLTGGQWIWSQPAKLQSTLPIGLVEFDIDASGGAMFMTGKGGVFALLDPKVNNWTALETPSSSSRGAGQGDLAVWTDEPASAPVRIRGWATDGKGVRTLLDPAPPGTCLVNVTPSAIVGITLEGGGGCQKPPWAPKSRFWWAPRKYDASGVSATLGQDLPGNAFVPLSVLPLRAWGAYVAVILGTVNEAGALDTDAYFLITNMSSGKTWRLDAEPGHRIRDAAWTITPTYFYYGDQEAADGPQIVRRMFRLELSKLDQWAKPQN
ncbi:MAG: hypothetical protein IPM35_35085 [Myxococcales bacterium]|nr:hypothetical protein [Myxococcales bacterium]